MKSTAVFPHALIAEMNSASTKEHGVVVFDVKDESEFCREYLELKSEGISEEDAREAIASLLHDLEKTSLIARLTSKQLLNLRKAGHKVEGCEDFYQEHDRQEPGEQIAISSN
ncbi:hypothetical protein EST38_g4932 [Candolleomyces aberdarensis]|uniref:Uncharacterized protein n=1 Tax=Candolleomyces aberdarensis TaxID=2316362 RepID=A0A4Q2DNI5_9AGAR|nr:hypothetical protein EST38_g4932 [Candolleomyces aberdarensis]